MGSGVAEIGIKICESDYQEKGQGRVILSLFIKELSAGDGTSYLDIASFIKSSGANPKQDLLELWKRIVFDMAASNTDDYLRNHAYFFQTKDGHSHLFTM